MAVALARASDIEPVGVNLPLVGSYSSADFREFGLGTCCEVAAAIATDDQDAPVRQERGRGIRASRRHRACPSELVRGRVVELRGSNDLGNRNDATSGDQDFAVGQERGRGIHSRLGHASGSDEGAGWAEGGCSVGEGVGVGATVGLAIGLAVGLRLVPG